MFVSAKRIIRLDPFAYILLHPPPPVSGSSNCIGICICNSYLQPASVSASHTLSHFTHPDLYSNLYERKSLWKLPSMPHLPLPTTATCHLPPHLTRPQLVVDVSRAESKDKVLHLQQWIYEMRSLPSRSNSSSVCVFV